jgi:hypothetical protein
MVLSQCVVVAGLAMSTNEMSCESSDGCPQRGTYCHVGESDSCWYCGSSTPLPTETDTATGGTMNKADAERHGLPRVVGFNATLVTEACSDPLAFSLNGCAGPASIASWCETCVAAEWHTARDLHGAELITVGVDTETAESHRAANVSSMGSVDWAALIFASLIVALTVVGEIKDIKLVTLAIRHAGDKLSSRWRFALTAIGVVLRLSNNVAGACADHRVSGSHLRASGLAPSRRQSLIPWPEAAGWVCARASPRRRGSWFSGLLL